MKKVNINSRTNVVLAFLTLALAGVATTYADNRPQRTPIQIVDSIQRQRIELPNMTQHMAQSAYPVKLLTIGNTVCVKSPYQQVLPIYTSSGSFYTAFRLNKGTNWLNGLPRGSYLINNRKITIV